MTCKLSLKEYWTMLQPLNKKQRMDGSTVVSKEATTLF